MIAERKNDAVSPVIGILLMLVVTIIIAAVVSGFAGSLASDESKAPQVTLGVTGVIQNISPAGPVANGIEFVHKGGDAFSLADVYLQIQSGNTKTTVDLSTPLQTVNCLPASVTAYMMEVGDSDGIIKTGDKFMVYADNCALGDQYGGPQISWKPEGAPGGFGAYLNTKLEYKLVDKKSEKTIQQGSFVLS